MEKVTGIGGIFFRAKNPELLARWYEEHLGVSPIPKCDDATPWKQEAGATHFAPFDAETEYFGAKSQSWMINFRVNDLDAMIKQLEGAGIEIVLDTDNNPNGNFARLHDPEGNPVELWQPKI